MLTDPPEQAQTGDRFAFGRYRHPIPEPFFGTSLRQRFRLKEWHYCSVMTDRWFVAFGLVQLGYVANAFLYLVDRERPEPAHEFEAMAPLGLGTRFAPSSIDGSTRFRHRGGRIEIVYDEGWQTRIDLKVEGKRLTGSYLVEPQESLALLHPLGPDRAAYTHKAAALPTAGLLTFGDQRISLDGGLANLDWTRSLADRETRWKWASFAHRSGDVTLGLNLSAEVYDDAAGDSRENAVWVDGQVHALGGVRFEVPRNPGCEDWRIVSREGDEVDLTFTPLGARSQALNLRLVRSDFVQPYGSFRGRVRGHEVDGAFGVVEDHHAVW